MVLSHVANGNASEEYQQLKRDAPSIVPGSSALVPALPSTSEQSILQSPSQAVNIDNSDQATIQSTEKMRRDLDEAKNMIKKMKDKDRVLMMAKKNADIRIKHLLELTKKLKNEALQHKIKEEKITLELEKMKSRCQVPSSSMMTPASSHSSQDVHSTMHRPDSPALSAQLVFNHPPPVSTQSPAFNRTSQSVNLSLQLGNFSVPPPPYSQQGIRPPPPAASDQQPLPMVPCPAVPRVPRPAGAQGVHHDATYQPSQMQGQAPPIVSSPEFRVKFFILLLIIIACNVSTIV